MTQIASDTSTPIAPFVFAVRSWPLLLLRLEAVAALVAAVLAYRALGGGWAHFAWLFLVPDLSMLAYLAGKRVGSVAYNAAHSYVGPALLATLGQATALPECLLLALIWVSHIGMDRALGYGLKYATSFGDTHLGRKGRTDLPRAQPR